MNLACPRPPSLRGCAVPLSAVRLRQISTLPNNTQSQALDENDASVRGAPASPCPVASNPGGRSAASLPRLIVDGLLVLELD